MKHALLLLVLFGSLSYSAMASNGLLHRDKLTRRDSAALELVQLWGYAQGAHDVLLQSPSPTLVNNLTAADSVCFDRAIQFIRHYGYPTPTLLGKYTSAHSHTAAQPRSPCSSRHPRTVAKRSEGAPPQPQSAQHVIRGIRH